MLKTEEGEVTDGRIDFVGQRIDHYGPGAIAKLGISQAMEGRRVLEHLSVEENLLVGAYRRKIGRCIKEDLEMVFQRFPKIQQLRRRTSGYLSGGEQQMLVIGRALMARPKLMLLDEPSLGLAPLLVQDIYEISQAHQRRAAGWPCCWWSKTSTRPWPSRMWDMSWKRPDRLSGPAEALMHNEDVREL